MFVYFLSMRRRDGKVLVFYDLIGKFGFVGF